MDPRPRLITALPDASAPACARPATPRLAADPAAPGSISDSAAARPDCSPAAQRPATMLLAPGKARRIDAEAGAVIAVLDGRVWLTLSGHFDDFVLIAGDRFRVPHAGRIVVEAWPDRGALRAQTCIAVTAAAAPGAVAPA